MTVELPQKFLDVVAHEGAVALVTWSDAEPHLTNTWNTYLTITEDGRILAPAAGMSHLEADLQTNPKILMSVGAREVEGRNGYQGTGFRIEGTARLLTEGPDFDLVKGKYDFLRKVLEITPALALQLL
jgi:predicted pyridoxine 5'-phosphate oxidase superfamily flavin-nucleotide-binding protein